MEDLNEEYGLSSFENFYDKFLVNSMKQANANYDRWKDARDVDKAYEEFLARLDPTNTPYWVEWAERRTKAFAKFYAQRCGIEVGNECVHCHKIKLIENGVCNCCGGEQ